VKFNAVQLSQSPDDPRVVLDPNTDSSSAAPSPAEPHESKPRPSPPGTRRRPARDPRPSPLSLTVDGS
jgi:hypothetical protein